MAPLYSRYIPPKPSALPESPATNLVKIVNAVPTPDTDNKRKRERSEDEKAERKAKKLRKKGLEDAAEVATAETGSAQAVGVPPASPEAEAAVEDATVAPRSEFAHIKSAKKRHKLEKEARKAKKQAEKLDQGDQAVAAVEDATASAAQEDVNGEVEDEGVTGEIGKQAEEPAQHGAVAASEEAEQESAAADKEEKRRRRRRKHEEAKEVKESVDAGPPALEATQDSTAGVDIEMKDAAEENAVLQPKKRRHKLEAALQPAADQNQDGDQDDEMADGGDDEHLKNHSSILSKFQKAKKLAEKKTEQPARDSPSTPEPQVEERDLAPFPQPVSEPQDPKPAFSALPPWLAEPTTISNDARCSFADLQLPTPTLQQLQKLGFNDALPVQQSLIPLLLPPGTSGSNFLPGTDSILPDVAVSAATGSGKTIAYLLPMIEALKHKSLSCEKLRALVVVPTRELVTQVAAVAESLTKGSNLKVGTASGVGKFRDEQSRLIKTGRRYDPATYAALMAKAHRRNNPPDEDSEEFDEYVEELEQWDEHLEQELQDALHGLVDHMPTYSSAVDILVCTPGRLLEHTNGTRGFELTHVLWLVLDEADRLLDQQYDGFLQRLKEELSRPRTEHEQDAREKVLRRSNAWDEQFERKVRKVVLSATMTRDISKLIALKLRRPKMVVVQAAEPEDADGAEAESGVYELPTTLREYYVPIGDGSEKPLHLLELLRTRILADADLKSANADEETGDDSSDSSSDVASDSESSASSFDSSSVSEASSSDVSGSDSSDSDTEPEPKTTATHKPLEPANTTPSAPTVLIFTSSTESATRLSHLLAALHPPYKPHLTTLTKTTRNPFPSPPPPSSPILTISTDRAGRGLDALAGRRITHVLQYDVPRSVTSYVHRVGRTARAGSGGEAWTLYSEREARWFVNEVVRSAGIRRAGEVNRVRVGSGGGAAREKFEAALGRMREAVFGGGR